MKLDKTHLNQFENISPPMRDALTIPVQTDTTHDSGVHLYVCGSTFGPSTSRKRIRRVADQLRLIDPELVGRLRRVLAASDSYDDEHDTLVALYEAITGEDAPEAKR